MFIKNIKIKNFKAFNEEIVIDLNPNSNKIDSDIENNYFIKTKDDKTFFSPVVSIGGANGTGKTSILETLNIMKKISQSFLINEIDLNSFIVSNRSSHNIRYNIYKNKLEIKTLSEEINLIIKKIFGDIDINSFIYISKNEFCNKLKIQEPIVSKYSAWKFLGWESIYLILNFKYKGMVQLWIDNKHFKNDISSISLTLFDLEKNQECYFKIIDDPKQEYKPSFEWEIEDNEFNKLDTKTIDLFANKIFDFVKKIFLFSDKEKLLKLDWDSDFIVDDYFYNRIPITNHRNSFLQSLIIEIKNYMKLNDEDTISFVNNILSIVDKSIKEIEFLNSKYKLKSGIKQINLIDGSSVAIDKLSAGTSRFIELFFIFILFLQNNYSCTLLIDEFDSLMHIDLVNFFKRLVIKINKMRKNKIQLIFTSHNYDCLTDNLSSKQMFFIDEIDGIKSVKKVSSIINKNHSPRSMYKKQIIGSHPFSSDIDDMIFEILKGGK